MFDFAGAESQSRAEEFLRSLSDLKNDEDFVPTVRV
jgi:hypothetical protein